MRAQILGTPCSFLRFRDRNDNFRSVIVRLSRTNCSCWLGAVWHEKISSILGIMPVDQGVDISLREPTHGPNSERTVRGPTFFTT